MPQHIPAWASSRMTHCDLNTTGEKRRLHFCLSLPPWLVDNAEAKTKVLLRTFVNEEIRDVAATHCQRYCREPRYHVVHPTLQEQTGWPLTHPSLNSTSPLVGVNRLPWLPWNVETTPWSRWAARTTGCKMFLLSTGVRTSWTLEDGRRSRGSGWGSKHWEHNQGEMSSREPREQVPDWRLLQQSQQERAGHEGERPRTRHLLGDEVAWKTRRKKCKTFVAAGHWNSGILYDEAGDVCLYPNANK